jgi:hypothetical protein
VRLSSFAPSFSAVPELVPAVPTPSVKVGSPVPLAGWLACRSDSELGLACTRYESVVTCHLVQNNPKSWKHPMLEDQLYPDFYLMVEGAGSPALFVSPVMNNDPWTKRLHGRNNPHGGRQWKPITRSSTPPAAYSEPSASASDL